jgi:hypothetical protein
MKSACLFLLLLAISPGTMVAQNSSNEHKALSVWNIHTRDAITLRAAQSDPIAVLTPTQPIVVRRIEALSMRGPVSTTVTSPEPIPCPVPFSLEITNGRATKTVPISTAFLKKGSQQTYTDSGLLSLPFAPGDRIAVALVVPAAGFPPTSCVLNGLNISIQFESVNPVQAKAN